MPRSALTRRGAPPQPDSEPASHGITEFQRVGHGEWRGAGGREKLSETSGKTPLRRLYGDGVHVRGRRACTGTAASPVWGRRARRFDRPSLASPRPALAVRRKPFTVIQGEGGREGQVGEGGAMLIARALCPGWGSGRGARPAPGSTRAGPQERPPGCTRAAVSVRLGMVASPNRDNRILG